MELRKWKRQGLSLDIELKLWHPGGEEVIKCKTMDICLGGAMLSTPQTLPSFRLLEFHFSNRCSKDAIYTPILAQAIRKNKHGTAIEFKRARNGTIKHLHEVMNSTIRINPMLEYSLPSTTCYKY